MTDTVSDTRMEQAHQQPLPVRNIPEWYQTSEQCHGEKEGGEVTRSAWGEMGRGGLGYFIYMVSKCEPVLTEGEKTDRSGKEYSRWTGARACASEASRDQGGWTTASRARLLRGAVREDQSPQHVCAHGDHQERLWSELGAMLSCSNPYLGFLGKCTVLPNLEKNKK